MKKSLGLFCILCCLSLSAGAQTPPPPWLAMVDGEHLSFPDHSCTEGAATALRRLGFARVTVQPGQVLAAFKPGTYYQYKAAVKCFPKYDLVNVTVVAQRSGGLKKARSILAVMRQFATQVAPLPTPEMLPDTDVLDNSATGFPDCSDGPTLIRCLNSVPNDSIDLAVEYLRKR